MGELSEQLKRKLALLESEMERFKRENAALEKLRLQKEQVHTDTHECVCEAYMIY